MHGCVVRVHVLRNRACKSLTLFAILQQSISTASLGRFFAQVLYSTRSRTLSSMLSAVPNSIFDLSAVASKGAAQGSNASPSKRREPLTATPYRSLARRWPSGSTTAGRRCQSWTQITGLRTITEGLRTGRATSTGKPGSGKPSARGIGWVVKLNCTYLLRGSTINNLHRTDASANPHDLVNVQ